MRCPTVSELPPPPPGKTGWPWTEDSPRLSGSRRDGRSWPLVSIVTPSYNQGEFLEETIRSVLLQGYSNLEYIIIDGGSTDNSVELVRKYEPWIAHWVSEKDRGQTQALNKGFSRAHGAILAWLNSDDVYLPTAVPKGATYLLDHSGVGMVYADCYIIDDRSRVTSRWISPEFSLAELVFKCFIPQQTAFFTERALQSAGPLSERLTYVMDYDLWLRFARICTMRHIPHVLAEHRQCAGTKTVSQRVAFWPEIVDILASLFSDPSLPPSVKALEREAYGIARLHEALQWLELGDCTRASALLATAFETEPSLVDKQRERVIGMLVAYAGASRPVEESLGYLGALRNSLPNVAAPLGGLLPIASSRVSILRANRSRLPIEVNLARSALLDILLHNRHWIRERGVASEIVSLIVGPQVLASIVSGVRQKRHAVRSLIGLLQGERS